jgi:hypothetical protein
MGLLMSFSEINSGLMGRVFVLFDKLPHLSAKKCTFDRVKVYLPERATWALLLFEARYAPVGLRVDSRIVILPAVLR